MPDKDTKENGSVTVADVYREHYAHFESMNDILYRVPPLFSLALFGASQIRADKAICASKPPTKFPKRVRLGANRLG